MYALQGGSAFEALGQSLLKRVMGDLDRQFPEVEGVEDPESPIPLY